MQPESEYLSTKQAAERIGRTPDWMYRVRKQPGEGPPFYKIGGRYQYRPTEIMTWLRGRRVA